MQSRGLRFGPWGITEGVPVRAVIQRVKGARVETGGGIKGQIHGGLLIFLGVGEKDTEKDCEYLANKIVHLRVFADSRDLMNLSLLDTRGATLVVSQFTLLGTQLCLTHIDPNGNSSPAVLLENFTAPDRAANIPEFVNAKSGAIKKIREDFLNDYSFVRAGNEFFKAGDTDNAIQEYQHALELNPNNAEAHLKLGFLFYNAKHQYKQGMEHYNLALKANPNDPRVHHDLGMALLHQRQFDLAIKHLSVALRGMPDGLDKQYNPVNMNLSLALAFFYSGRSAEAIPHFSQVIQRDPNNAQAHYWLSIAMADQKDLDGSLEHYQAAVKLRPEIDKSATLHYLLAMNYAERRRFSEAVLSAEKALSLASAAGDVKYAQQISKFLEQYKHRNNNSNDSNEK